MLSFDRLFVAALAALALAACSSAPATGGSCSSDADCGGAGFHCHLGRCYAPVASASGGSTSTGGSSGGSTTTGGQSSSGGSSTTSGAASSSGSTSSGSTTTVGGSTSGGSSSGGSTTSGGSTSGGSTTSGGSSSGGSTGGACPGGCTAPFSCDAASGLCKNQGVPQLSHVWIVLMENTNFSSVAGQSASSYMVGTLFPMGVEMTNFTDGMVHPSLPNYLCLTGGDNFGITADGPASSANYQVASGTLDIAIQLENAGLSWHEYSESQTSPCQLSDSGSDANNDHYVSKHNPMPHFLDTQASATCQTNDVSWEPESGMPGIAADLAAGTAYSYNFISPNLCDDGHDTCTSTPLQQQDDWLRANLPTILTSSAYQRNGLVIVTWDEGENDTDQIMTMILSPMLKSPGTQNGTLYSHFSTLATIEAGFGLANLPAQYGHTDALITDLWK